MQNLSEIVALISDLDLRPLNYWASDFYQILENEDIRRNRIKCDLREMYKRNHKLKYSQYVYPSDCGDLFGSLE